MKRVYTERQSPIFATDDREFTTASEKNVVRSNIKAIALSRNIVGRTKSRFTFDTSDFERANFSVLFRRNNITDNN